MNLLTPINYLLIFLLQGLRPLLGPSACRYSVGCTQYAVDQLREQNLFVAIWLVSKRLIACNPFNFYK